MADESTTTVVVAAAANLGIAVAKGVAGALSGSAAMISESAHSLADTANELLLLVAVKRSDRPADERHPFGYGRERYFWTLLAAVGICVGGGVFSVMQGINELRQAGDEGGHFILSYVILGISFALESVSWLQVRSQLRNDARRMSRGMREQLQATSDPAVTTVFLEDSAALVGLLIAATGIALHQATGSHIWDGLASLAIGLLLVGAGVFLGRQNQRLLIGEAADPRLREALTAQLATYEEIDSVDEVLTSIIGRGEVLVAARIDLDDTLSAAQVEALARRIEREVIEAHPSVRHFFVDVTADHRWPTQD
ncbi:MAG TPA: cation diffusion facilitator family transporter [Mycobacteriales bacterium]|nr:cation diffusion facilitator family transporter [Mycobacteriales bacterium]HVX69357.1 cation diffusion facilitator family transporter [Mycobacteriales bacterium]